MSDTNKFDFYWDDLTDECKVRLENFLGGENGNYDIMPFASLEISVDEKKTTTGKEK